ncbi:MAG: hypothetical protein DCC73_12020 [Proteobacteria bacterium]|nr:MAG: hypothetical protein DCC73_12020 [Pseudomonadota bacterium]
MKTGSDVIGPYRLALADTPELIHVAYKLRHHAYCMRAGFERRDMADMEVDGFDRRAVHVLVFYRDWPLACARLILPPVLPLLHHCPDVPLEPGAAEVSRFSIPAPTARQTFNVITVLRLLGQGVWEAGQRHRVASYYLLMKPALKSLLKRAGFECEPVGAPVELHGRRIPTRFSQITAAEREDGVFQHPEPRA